MWDATVVEIRAWLRLNPTLRGEAALLPNRDGQAMSRSNVAQRLGLAVTRAAVERPSLLDKRVSPHTLRHTSAMHLLAMKEKALARLQAPDTKLRRYRAPDSLMRFLQTL